MSQPRERAKHSRLPGGTRSSMTVLSLVALAACLLPGENAWAYVGWMLYAAAVLGAVMKSDLARFGWANRVTLLRGLLLLLTLPQLAPDPRYLWLPPILGAVALALDGVDGRIARRTGEASAFGARFDMETDALTVLVLSALVAAQGRVGAWVLLSGALRYLYVAAGWLWPRLARPVPPSLARKLVCVLQIAGLLLALLPIVPPPWPAAVAAVSLGLLVWSFGRDVVWLLCQKGMAESPIAPYLPQDGGV